MSDITLAIPQGIPVVKQGTVSLNQAAGTYDLLTASGDVYVEVLSAYVYTAASGLTTASLQTNHAVNKSIMAATVAASLTLDAIIALVVSSFILKSGQKIQCTIVGTGSGGQLNAVVRYTPLTSGASLA